MKRELPQRLKQLDEEMMAADAKPYKHIFAVRDGQRFEIRIMRSPKNEYIATTTQRLGTYLLRGRGPKPSDAFLMLTRIIAWNLRKDVQQTMSKSIEANRTPIFVPMGQANQ